jgi:DNA-binding NtrC family response regulator
MMNANVRGNTNGSIAYNGPYHHYYSDPSRILVIDDELTVCKSCDKILTEDGYAVISAQGGWKGLEQARKENFDLALVDLKMPDINGMEVVETLKREHPNMAVIIMTGYSSVASAVTGMKLGAADYIPKPFTPDEMSVAVKKALQQQQQRAVGRKQAEPVIHKDAIIAVLKRAAEDSAFIEKLTNSGSEALKDYDLAPDEEAALLSGDVVWLEKHVGKLDDKLNTWVECRLQQERW